MTTPGRSAPSSFHPVTGKLPRLWVTLALSLGLALWLADPAAAQNASIDRSQVFIIASALTDPLGGLTVAPSPLQPVNPRLDPVVRAGGTTELDHEVVIQVPDMDPSDSGPRAGVQEGIATGASVTVIFAQGAGIKNPFQAGNNPVRVVTNPPGSEPAGLSITAVPNTAGLAAEYQLTFTVNTDIPANSGTIVITFDEDFQFPGEPVTVPPTADLSVTTIGAPDSVASGAGFGYEVRVSNDGPGEAAGVVLDLELPVGLKFQGVGTTQGICRGTLSMTSCDLGRLPAGGVAVVMVQVAVAPQVSGRVSIIHRVQSEAFDPFPGNDRLTTPVVIVARPTATVIPTTPLEPTPTPVPTPTATPVPTATLVPTPTPVPTATPVPAATSTPAPTGTAVPLPTPTPSPPTEEPAVPTATPSPTETPAPSSGGCAAPGQVSGEIEASWLLLLLAPLAAGLVRRRP